MQTDNWVEKIPLNELGQKDGKSITYYNDGTVKSEGNFKNGLYLGDWKNFDENGKLMTIDSYNSNGNLIHSRKQ